MASGIKFAEQLLGRFVCIFYEKLWLCSSLDGDYYVLVEGNHNLEIGIQRSSGIRNDIKLQVI
jgi:hypothetical protein